MTQMLDEQLEARFAALANWADDSDWQDVLVLANLAETEVRPATAVVGVAPAIRIPHQRRSRTRGHARLGLVLSAIALAVAVTAVAFGWPSDFVNFLSAPSAPSKVKNSFGAQNVIAPPGMNPQAIPGKARRIMAARFDATGIHPGKGGWHVLYVAPTGPGGFCFEWSHFTGSCFEPTRAANTPVARAAGPLGVTWLGDDFPQVLAGYVRTGETKSLEARFAGGASVDIPVTWVSAPINAGFFIYIVPPAHRSTASAVRSIVALDANGKVIGTQIIPAGSPLDRIVPTTLPDGTRVPLSARAEPAKARKIVSFTAKNGSRVYLWVMPRRGGGECYVYNQGGGCPPPGALNRGPAFAGGLSIGTKRVLFFAEAEAKVTQIELRYQDGSREELTPIDGFVLHEITPAHYPQGRRLAVAIATNSNGRVLYRQEFQPQAHGTYPCEKPVSRGYGVRTCP